MTSPTHQYRLHSWKCYYVSWKCYQSIQTFKVKHKNSKETKCDVLPVDSVVEVIRLLPYDVTDKRLVRRIPLGKDLSPSRSSEPV